MIYYSSRALKGRALLLLWCLFRINGRCLSIVCYHFALCILVLPLGNKDRIPKLMGNAQVLAASHEGVGANGLGAGGCIRMGSNRCRASSNRHQLAKTDQSILSRQHIFCYHMGASGKNGPSYDMYAIVKSSETTRGQHVCNWAMSHLPPAPKALNKIWRYLISGK